MEETTQNKQSITITEAGVIEYTTSDKQMKLKPLFIAEFTDKNDFKKFLDKMFKECSFLISSLLTHKDVIYNNIFHEIPQMRHAAIISQLKDEDDPKFKLNIEHMHVYFSDVNKYFLYINIDEINEYNKDVIFTLLKCLFLDVFKNNEYEEHTNLQLILNNKSSPCIYIRNKLNSIFNELDSSVPILN